MTNDKYNLAEMQVAALSNLEIIQIIGGGENMFYDAGVAVGRSVVQAFRWWNSVIDENMANSQSVLLL